MFLDPKSSEGLFRHAVEKQYTGDAGLRQEVGISIELVRQLGERVRPPALGFRLYEHRPFSFIIAFDTAVYVEQYLYRNPRKRSGGLHLAKYPHDSERFTELVESLNTIWKHSYSAILEDHRVGTANAINEAGIRNMFRRDQRTQLADAQWGALLAVSSEDSIRILAITGKFYVLGRLGPTVRRASEPQPDGIGGQLVLQFSILCLSRRLCAQLRIT